MVAVNRSRDVPVHLRIASGSRLLFFSISNSSGSEQSVLVMYRVIRLVVGGVRVVVKWDRQSRSSWSNEIMSGIGDIEGGRCWF